MEKKSEKIESIRQAEQFRVPYYIFIGIAVLWGIFLFSNDLARYKIDLKALYYILSIGQYIEIFNLGNMVLFAHIINLILVFWFIAASYGVGRFILGFFDIAIEGILKKILFYCGAGFVFLIYFIFVLGILGLLFKWIVILFLAFVSIPSVVVLKKDFIEYKKSDIKPYLKFGFLEKIVLAVFLLQAALNLIGSLSPEIFFDSLHYHLAVPDYYILHNRIQFMPHNAFSHLPSNIGLLYAIGLLLKDEMVSKLIHFILGLLSCGILYQIGNDYFNRRIGLISIVIFYVMPLTAANSWTGGIEMGIIFFTLLSWYCITHQLSKDSLDYKWIILFAVFSGIAMGSKYTAVFSLTGAVVVLVIWMINRKYPSFNILKAVFLCFLISFLILSPWLLRNYIATKNPIYPYLSSLFYRGVSNEKLERLKIFTTEARQYDIKNIKDYILNPWLITLGKKPNSELFSPIFLFFGVFLILLKRLNNHIKFFLVYFIIQYFLWSISTTMIRFFLPGLAVFAVIIAYEIEIIGFNKIVQRSIFLIIIFVSLVNLYWSLMIYYGQEGWRVAFGSEGKGSYLSTAHASYPPPSYSVIMYANKNLNSHSRILFLGEERGFYLKRDYITASVGDVDPLLLWMRDSLNEDELHDLLKRERITHIILNVSESIRLERDYKIFNWSSENLRVFNMFFKKYVKEIYKKDEIDKMGRLINSVILYEIMGKKEADNPHVVPVNYISDVIFPLSQK